MYKALIVDDEAMARGNLVESLRRHARWSPPLTLSSGATLIETVAEHAPDVVFLDIQMPGEDGMSLARQLLSGSAPPLIVFVTAYSEHAVTAFELYAVDYLLKPFDDQRLAQCVARLEAALDNPQTLSQTRSTQSALANGSTLQRLVIKSAASLRIIEVAKIHWLAANGNYVDIHHSDGTHLMRASLRQLLAGLSDSEFTQVHRGFAVRHSLVREVKTIDGDRSDAVLSTGDTVPIGKSFRQNLMTKLQT